MEMIYVPEMDHGEAGRGKAFISAEAWIPLENFTNPESFLRMATLQSVSNRPGGGTQLCLARRERYHMVIARHLHTDWSPMAKTYTVVDLSSTWDRVDFGERIAIRAGDQEDAWEALSQEDHGVLNLACGKGKTILALKKISQRGFPAIVIVNNEGLIDQWLDRAREFLNLREDQLGVVQGTKAQWDRPFVVAMIHTLAARADAIPLNIRMRFGTVVFDEVHHLSAATFVRVAPLFFGDRVGLTATLEREDGLESAYYAHVGDPFYSDLQGELTASIYFKKLPFALPSNAPEMTDRTGEFSVGKLYTYLGGLAERNRAILDFIVPALEVGRKILVLTHSAEHPDVLKEMVDRLYPGRWVSGSVSGKTRGPMRTQIIRDSNVTFATTQVAREALDVSALDTLLFITPFRAWGVMQQGKGRIERRHSGKLDPIVVVMDDGGIGPAHAMCRSLRRLVKSHGYSYADIG